MSLINILLQLIKKRQMSSRLNWTADEQNLLKMLKEEHNISSWKKIAQILNEKMPESVRTGKQCRDRYINYVRFSSQTPKRVGWTQEDDRYLFQKFQQHGTKWVSISSEMPDRSENNLKNRFYGAMRKIMRKIVKVQKQMKPKPKKVVKQRQLIRIFQQCKNTAQSKLYHKLLTLAIAQEDQISQEEVKNVLSMIHSYTSNISLINIKNQVVQTKSFATEVPQKANFLDDILMQIQKAQEVVQDNRQDKNAVSGLQTEDNSNYFLKTKSLSLLKDSLRIDFSDMRNLECDPQREIADKLFTFEYEGNIY